MWEAALYLGLSIVGIVVAVKLAKRLGYDGTTGLLMMIPIVNYIVLAVWAFTESPNERKIRDLQREISNLELTTGQSPVAFLEGKKDALSS
jgi:hypothetical protein